MCVGPRLRRTGLRRVSRACVLTVSLWEDQKRFVFRRCDATTVRDSFTQELTRLLYDNLFELTGNYPTMVINLLSRVKLDANRDINEATFGEEEAVDAWEEFHRSVKREFQSESLYYVKEMLKVY